MPELPEVETIRRQLARAIVGATIKDVIVRFSGRLNLPAKKFVQAIKGKKIISIGRRAKLLIFKLSGGRFVLAHLKMSGRFFVKGGKGREREGKGGKVEKYTRVIFKLSGGKELRWNDFRKLGYLKLLNKPAAQKFMDGQKYGPEPLDKSFTWKKMALCLRSRPKAKIKPLLMEQACVAGVGNIYVTEALWFAKIHPLTPVGKISDARMRALHRDIVSVLKKAVAAHGTSADAYLDVFGKEGTFEKQLKVYGREGKPCPRCRAAIRKTKISGRGSAYCPRCQRLP